MYLLNTIFTYCVFPLGGGELGVDDDEDIDGPEHFDDPDFVYDDNDYDCFNRKGLHILHINARSLRNNIAELTSIAEKSKASVIAITETWFDSSMTDAEVALHGYNIKRKDRNANGGGVCIYIKDTLAFNPQTDLDNEHLEALWIDILMNKSKPILVGCVYRPPKQSNFLQHFQETLSEVPTERETIILGDFNICEMHKQSKMFKCYTNIMKMFALTQLIREPTRVTNRSSTLLDHILACKSERIVQSGTIAVGSATIK